jgi:hypothetical protein
MSQAHLLERGRESFRVDASSWAETLAIALRFGWNPPGPAGWYLANGFEVSENAAAALSDALGRAFHSASETPLSFYPVRIDMGVLSRIHAFIQEGGFVVMDA